MNVTVNANLIIDVELFKIQKQDLIKCLSIVNDGDVEDSIEGILELLDEIQDQIDKQMNP